MVFPYLPAFNSRLPEGEFFEAFHSAFSFVDEDSDSSHRFQGLLNLIIIFVISLEKYDSKLPVKHYFRLILTHTKF